LPEILSTAEVAHVLGHGGLTRRQEIIEIVEAILLAVVAVATAWSGYEAARWDGRQAALYGISSKERLLSSQAASRSGQLVLYDNSVFSFWLQAHVDGNQKQARVFERRFRPEFRRQFNAWLATHPFTDPNAPAGPLIMAHNHNAQADVATVYDRRATATFEAGTAARERGEHYLRNTLLLATLLFLTALAGRFRMHSVRIGVVVLSAGLLALALYYVATYPRA
jgi:hypothetical protein